MGRTHSRVGIYNGTQLNIVTNKDGYSNIPSVVTFIDDGTAAVGLAATNQMPNNPKNTVYNVRYVLDRPLSTFW